MWKSLFLKAIQLLTLTLLITQFTFLPALAQESKSSEAVNKKVPEAVNPSKVDSTVTDEKTGDSNQSKKAPEISSPRSKTSQSTRVYDKQAIQKFDEELYGAGN
jgi:hypothetical protein